MRFVVVGAGAVGATIAGRLGQADEHVLLVARGANYKAIRSHGLVLDTEGAETVLPIPVCQVDELRLDPDDVLVLAVKTGDSAAILTQLATTSVDGESSAALIAPILLAQNGVENERLALRWFRHVYGMSVAMFAEHLVPARIRCVGFRPYGVFDVGRFPRGVDDTAEAIVDALGRAGYDAAVQPDILRWKYAKLVRNLVNAVRALTDDPQTTHDVLALAKAEAYACFAAAGVDVASAEEMEARRGDLTHPGDIHGSTWQSLVRRSGSVETDYLNGEIVLLGRLHDVPTPINEGLQIAMNLASRRSADAGALSGDELRSRLRLDRESGPSR